jgi:hypothetical protein
MSMSALRKTRSFVVRLLGASTGAQEDREVLGPRRLGLFDEVGYLRRYPKVAVQGTDPALHYAPNGARERRNPCDLFDTAYYQEKNPDAARVCVNPFLHYRQRK